MLQMLLLLMGLLQAASLARSLWTPGGSPIGHFGLVLATSNLVMLVGCFSLLRCGYFKLAAHLFIAGTVVLLAVGHAHWGLEAQLRYQVTQTYPVLIAGLLLNRKALWLAVAGLCMVVALGALRDVSAGLFINPEMCALDSASRSWFVLLVIALILDRAVSAFHGGFEKAVRRGDDLERIRDLLQVEMRERERAREQLIHAQKVEAVGRLASGVAHDFGNLLSLILGYARVGSRSDDPDALKKALAGVDVAARRANAVSQKLLSFSRQDDTRMELFDAAEALQQMQPMLRQLFDPTVDLALDAHTQLPEIRFDRTQFELVVLNIAANANHAMPDGGCFRLSVRADVEASCVEIDFSDTGVGIGQEIQQRIFEPFFTTKPRGEGTGLGLAVAKDLLIRAGGNLTVRSSIGVGTTFCMTLPLQQHGNPRLHEVAAPAPYLGLPQP